ncbi:coiled-coil domain-containing protein 8 homolog isoform X2 [Esox lucius]|uniref:coiled-coil domain-containing protein 8 homolog isoform X2 n=1 Tax=Esox lucius TaxID=8010 RepID=UPI001477077E|nr:coiled-coil domain-containing protein 8 homolog isoform X2 [Esox lucius]
MMPSFSVVEFVDEIDPDGCNKVDIIPSEWFKGTDGKLCWWPPATLLNVTKAVKKGTPPAQNWILCNVRVMGNAATYAKARVKLHQAEYTSDLTDTEDGLIKRKARSKLFQSQSKQLESSKHSDSEDQLPPTPPKKLLWPAAKKMTSRITIPTAQQVASSTVQQIASSTAQRVASSTVQQIASPTAQRVASSTVQQIAIPTAQRVASSTVQQITSPTVQQIASSTVQQIASPTIQRVASSTVQQIASPTAQRVASSTVQQIASPTVQQIASSTVQQIASPTVQQIASPTAQRVASSTVQQIASPTAQRVASPTVQQIASPTVQQIASSTAQRVGSSTVQQIASPTAQRVACSTAQRVASSAVQQIASPTAQRFASPSCEAMVSKLLTIVEEIKETQKVHGKMLNVLLKKQDTSVMEVPDGVVFPLQTQEDVEVLEEQLGDRSLMSAVVAMVADIGGTNVDDATRRMMKYILSNELALDYNMFGRHGKKKFKDLCLFNVVYEALKKNSLTAQVNQQEAERALSKWFTGARDRGGRRAFRQPVPN